MATRISDNSSEPTFKYKATPKLQMAVEKAGRDFRSDVVTVPTESMMQVGTTRPFEICLQFGLI